MRVNRIGILISKQTYIKTWKFSKFFLNFAVVYKNDENYGYEKNIIYITGDFSIFAGE